jgi:hypothetical protein
MASTLESNTWTTSNTYGTFLHINTMKTLVHSGLSLITKKTLRGNVPFHHDTNDSLPFGPDLRPMDNRKKTNSATNSSRDKQCPHKNKLSINFSSSVRGSEFLGKKEQYLQKKMGASGIHEGGNTIH